MIPPFDHCGYLPPGIHPATLDGIEARFGRDTEIRRAQMDSIRWLLDLAEKAGVQRLMINGSFVTDALARASPATQNGGCIFATHFSAVTQRCDEFVGRKMCGRKMIIESWRENQ